MWMSTPGQRHQLKANFPKWRREHIQNWFCSVVTLPPESSPLRHKTVGNHLLPKSAFGKNCSPIILLHLPLFTTCRSFLSVPELNSHTPSSSLSSPTGIRLVSQRSPRQERFTPLQLRIHLREPPVAIITRVNLTRPRPGHCLENWVVFTQSQKGGWSTLKSSLIK